MKQGYNQRIDLLFPTLIGEPQKRQALVDELRKLPPEKKVLRFPGGTYIKDWNYSLTPTREWRMFCLDAEVGMNTYVWKLGDNEGSRKGYEELVQSLDIVCIEVHNESDIVADVNLGFWRNLVNNTGWLRDRYYFQKGKEYGNKFNNAYDYIRSIGYNGPIAANMCCEMPYNYRAVKWNQGVKKTAHPFKLADVVIHEYERMSLPPGDWLIDFENGMSSLSDYDWWFTEFNVLELTNQTAYSYDHRDRLRGWLGYAESFPNTKLAMIHGLYNLWNHARYVWEQGEMKDKYPGL